MATPWLAIASAASKLLAGIFGHRGAKRQMENQMLAANVGENFLKSNLLENALHGYGEALTASQRSGGFFQNALQSGFNNLAADLRMAQFNRGQQMAQIAANLTASRTSLLMNGVEAALGIAADYESFRRNKKIDSFLDEWNGGYP
jgi:hypothetical protein